MVSWLTRRGRHHWMVSVGCASSAPATQLVAGLPSNADQGWSSGSLVYVEDAVTETCPRPNPA